MAKSMAEMARELKGDLDPGLHPEEQAQQITTALRQEFPDSTARGRQRVAAKVAGAEPPLSNAEMDALVAQGSQRAPRSRAAASAARSGGGRLVGAGRRVAGRVGSNIGSPIGRAGTLRGLGLQAMGLVALYWVLRTPGAAAAAARAVQLSVGWLRSTRGIRGA